MRTLCVIFLDSQAEDGFIWARPVATGRVPTWEQKMSKGKDTKQQLTMDEVDGLLSKPWLHVPQAGAILGLNRSASYEAARRGEIETFKIGRLLKAPTAPLRKKLRIAE